MSPAKSSFFVLLAAKGLKGLTESPNSLFEEFDLIRMLAARDAPVVGKIRLAHQLGEPLFEGFEGAVAAGGIALTLPNFIESSRVTLVAAQDVNAPDAQPARNPDVDRIFFGEGALGLIDLGWLQKLEHQLETTQYCCFHFVTRTQIGPARDPFSTAVCSSLYLKLVSGVFIF